jgi:sulfur relay (sulfurtransferase) complex TusBCD TusD component (DsrE family)
MNFGFNCNDCLYRRKNLSHAGALHAATKHINAHKHQVWLTQDGVTVTSLGTRRPAATMDEVPF